MRPPMMTFHLLKFLHVIGATVLFGTGIGIAFFMVMAHRTGDRRVIAHTLAIVVLADFLFTATAVLLQPVTGWFLMRMAGYGLSDEWLMLSLALYGATGAFWLPVVWMQYRMRNIARAAVLKDIPLSPEYHRLYRTWFLFGFPAFAAVLTIFYLMIARPSF